MRYLGPAEDRHPIPGVQIRVTEVLVCLNSLFFFFYAGPLRFQMAFAGRKITSLSTGGVGR